MRLPLGSWLGAILAASFAFTAPAMAQLNGPRAINPKGLVVPKTEQQPAALPGARSVPAPADRSNAALNLRPNEALFDAVNRGDIGSAREALNRGADIEARNVLGATALELSVDLGRNDITFLLLSMRGSGTRNPPPPAAAPVAAPVAAATPRPAPAPRPVVAQIAPTPTPKTPAPRTAYSSDPGTPAPQSGFLGFAPPRS